MTIQDLSVGRRNNFDALRFFFALLVIFSHSYPLLGQARSEPLPRWLGIDGGALAVNAFFLISGFLIAQSWERSRSSLRYAEKRALRIYPGFLVALLLDLLVVCPLGGAHLPAFFHERSSYQFIYRPLFFREVWSGTDVFQHNPSPGAVNGSLWTIRFEIFCYALVAVFGVLGVYKKRGRVLALLLGMVIFGVLFPVRHWHLNAPYFGNLDAFARLGTFFVIGLAFYFFQDRIPHSPRCFWASVLLPVLAQQVLYFHHCPAWAVVLLGLVSLSGCYALFYIAFSPAVKLHDFGRRGDFSYGLYLYAFPVQQLLIHYSHAALNPTQLFLEAAPLTLVLAVASWYGVEKPFLQRKPAGQSGPKRLMIFSRSGGLTLPPASAAHPADEHGPTATVIPPSTG